MEMARKACDIPMICDRTGEIAFVVQVYGRSSRDLMTVPNNVIQAIAEKYPGYHSTPFHIIDRTRVPKKERLWG